MHRIATKDSIEDDLKFTLVEQTPSDIVILTGADTDIQTLANSLSELPSDFPTIRSLNLLRLKQEFVIDDYARRVLGKARVIVLRILGGISYWSYGLEVVKEIVQTNGAFLYVLPGDDQLDSILMSQSNVPIDVLKKLWEYFVEGGKNNLINGLKFLTDCSFATSYNPPRAQIIPKIGIYRCSKNNNKDVVAILFYRAHFLSGNLEAIDALVESLEQRGLSCVAIYVSSLRDNQLQRELLTLLRQSQIILNTTSFAIAQLGNQQSTEQFWHELNLPILQVILAGSKEQQWLNNPLGLTPSDLAMNVVLPEVDGRIITRAISFKEQKNWHPQLETEITTYKPKADRVDFVADLTDNWLKLKNTPINQRKIALVLANYPPREGRIANGVGLDTPQSALEILQALSLAGYHLEHLPVSSEDLIKQLRYSAIKIPLEQYLNYFESLPSEVVEAVLRRWGNLKQESDHIVVNGLQFGNVFIGIQPSRGYENDPNFNYHAPDLEPTHQYLAYYYWLNHCFKANAIVHVGKHGNLEWLPGKAVALCRQCYPEITLGKLPHFYPFIVNDPGEGTQAKRRASAVILDHLTPPMTRAELYGDLQKLESLIDEYYQAELLDPKRLKIISTKIKELLKTSQLELPSSNSFTSFIATTDGYLCELKEAQIRDGLHILGKAPTGRQLRDLIVAIARHSSWERLGLIGSLAQDFGLDFNPLTKDKAESFELNCSGILKDCRLVGDVLSALEDHAQDLVEKIIKAEPLDNVGEHTQKELDWIAQRLLPALVQCDQEIANLLAGLDGKYVPPGPSGAPTRGRPDVLPTGRNFYSVDIRSLPSETAWDMGKKAAEVLVERYCQENGEYPKNLAISIWGTATMRNAGEDLAQVLALLGVKPLWDGPSRRVVGFEIISPSVLARPRVDVTVRISGFFRDSFPTLIQLLDKAIAAVSALEEPEQINPLAHKVAQEISFYRQQGLNDEQAIKMARLRIFGSKPGAYGAGLQGLIEAQNWESPEDLARAYLNWSSYAYTYSRETEIECIDGSQALPERLKEIQIVLQNQDNREHDLLDSDDYYQFQGGLVVAARALSGQTPQIYFGDNSILGYPRVKSLAEELAKVYRSRVVNPKWLSGMMRHGYKGAFEMAATVDYLFAYDATTGQVPDYMYQGITEAYLLDPLVNSFIKQKNPHALRDIAERLLEAQQRGLWESATSQTLEQLKEIIIQAEEIIEEVIP